MTDELVKRLRANASWGDDRFSEAADLIEQLTEERDRLREALTAIRDATPRFDYVRIVPGDNNLSEPGSPYDRGKAEGFNLLQALARAALKGESHE